MDNNSQLSAYKHLLTPSNTVTMLLPLRDQSPSTTVVYGVVFGVGVAQRHLPRPLTLLGWLPIDNSKRPDIGEATLRRNLNRTGTSLEGRTQ